ncbi:MAG: SPOR domain-containing protein [Paracoccaceae bacterium]
MHDEAYEDANGAGQPASIFARAKSIVSTAIGAIVAMSLLMTLGIWFYRLGVRDAQNVPIIRAAADPAKERPEDPGGTKAPHQNIESYEVAIDRPASAAAVVIAPEPPQPKPEDVPLAEIRPAQTPLPQPEPELAEQIDAAIDQLAQQPASEPEATELAIAPVPEPEPAEPEPDPQSEPEPVATGTAFAPARSPTAPRRPANLVQRTAAAADQAVRQQDSLARSASQSRVQIQLAADPSESAMRARWERVRKANSDILRGRTLALQTTVSGGTTFYRLRVGPFKDAAEARNVCQALKARGQDCIVARNS